MMVPAIHLIFLGMISQIFQPAEPVSGSDRLIEAILQAEMLCELEGEQSEVCQLAQAYVEVLRSETAESIEAGAKQL